MSCEMGGVAISWDSWWTVATAVNGFAGSRFARRGGGEFALKGSGATISSRTPASTPLRMSPGATIPPIVSADS